MTREERLSAFVQLGKMLLELGTKKDWENYQSGWGQSDFEDARLSIVSAKVHNGWFTEENIMLALEAIGGAMEEERLRKWLSAYTEEPKKAKNIGVIMAGNLPLVGFHDFLCVLLSGHRFVGKLSSEDAVLIPKIAEILLHIEPRFSEFISFTDSLKEVDALIATGSDNSSRYFEHYFGKYPHIIRKNRTSVAVLNGKESEEELRGLAEDVFRYFGKGCRNVSKVYLPKGFDLDHLFKAFFAYKEIINHNKYANNYDYNKAVYLMNKIELIENGFILLKEDRGIHSPLSVLFYEFFEDESKVREFLKGAENQIQCLVSSAGEDVPFGKAQEPTLWDYADGVDTMKFLCEEV